MELIIGTLEKAVASYKFTKDENEGYKLELSFTNRPHLSAVSAAAACDKFLVTGSHDENIVIFNMKKRQEFGTLSHHTGSITCLEFFNNSHLFSGSEDGNICIWSTNKWECVKTLRGHKAGVIDLSIHHSGKLGMSISKDKKLHTWNLIRGRSQYITNIKSVASFIKFSPGGSRFILGVANRVDVYSLQTAMVTYSIKFGAKVECAIFITDELLAVCGEKREVEIYNIAEKCLIYTMNDVHDTRIKSMVHWPSKKEEEVSPSTTSFLATVASDGWLKVWEIHLLKSSITGTSLVAQVDIKGRPVCMTYWNPNPLPPLTSDPPPCCLSSSPPPSPPTATSTTKKRKSPTDTLLEASEEASDTSTQKNKKSKHPE